MLATSVDATTVSVEMCNETYMDTFVGACACLEMTAQVVNGGQRELVDGHLVTQFLVVRHQLALIAL